MIWSFRKNHNCLVTSLFHAASTCLICFYGHKLLASLYSATGRPVSGQLGGWWIYEFQSLSLCSGIAETSPGSATVKTSHWLATVENSLWLDTVETSLCLATVDTHLYLPSVETNLCWSTVETSLWQAAFKTSLFGHRFLLCSCRHKCL